MKPLEVRDPGRVSDLIDALESGQLTSEALVRRCLDRIAEVDGRVKAWIHVLSDEALGTARILDAERRDGKVRSRLHGLPVAVKDVLDVRGLATRANSESRTHLPAATADATVVAHLRAAGCIILGKVHTTEYAYFQSLPPTRNPWDLTRTPGGSSAGSAAAIASGCVPIALGTQTAGSINRPAAYCGIGGFKPSSLSIVGAGIVPFAPSFDTVGGLGATVRDAVALVTAFAPDHMRMNEAGQSWELATIVVLEDAMLTEGSAPGTAACLAAFVNSLASAGLSIRHAKSPVTFEALLKAHKTITAVEFARTYATLPRDKVCCRIAEDLDSGLLIPEQIYLDALHELTLLRSQFWASFGPNDIILSPAAPDIAPVASTSGDPSFIIPVTALSGPIATVRAGLDAGTGMPIGVLLFASPGSDARLAGFLESDVGTKMDL